MVGGERQKDNKRRGKVVVVCGLCVQLGESWRKAEIPNARMDSGGRIVQGQVLKGRTFVVGRAGQRIFFNRQKPLRY